MTIVIVLLQRVGETRRFISVLFYRRQQLLVLPQFNILGRTLLEWVCSQLSRWEENTLLLSLFDTIAGQKTMAPYHEIMANNTTARVGKTLPNRLLVIQLSVGEHKKTKLII